MNALPTTSIYEMVALRPGDSLPEKGASAEILRIGADRWLIIGPPPAAIAAHAAFATTDVTGKWRELPLTGPAATRLLANCVDAERLFAERECARTTVFDCPAVVRRLDDGYSVWIERSYLSAFLTAVKRAESF